MCGIAGFSGVSNISASLKWIETMNLSTVRTRKFASDQLLFSLSGPIIPIQRTVIDGFADVGGLNILAAAEVSDGSRDL